MRDALSKWGYIDTTGQCVIRRSSMPKHSDGSASNEAADLKPAEM
jgi:hypothetical protein